MSEAITRALNILAPASGPIALAISGGSDSTALLTHANVWARATRRHLIAATVDHGLRPEAADEAGAVADLCSGLGVSHRTLRWRPGSRRVSQADARFARHSLLATWARAAGAPVLALGHTEDDRIETFLIRARAGSGWRGLAGLAPRSPSPAWPEGAGLALIRPALACSRESLRADLLRRGLNWIEDPSNTSDRYERVRMRALVQRLSPATRASIRRSMDRLSALRAAALVQASEGLATLLHHLPPAACALDAEGFRRLGRQPGLFLAEALVLAAGGASGPLPSKALARLHGMIIMPGALARAVTLAGAKIEDRGAILHLSQAPPRRGNHVSAPGFAVGLELAFARAASLLADPALATMNP